MTLRKRWLVSLVAVAVIVYLTMWLGWALRWDWLARVDLSVLGQFHGFGVDHPAWVTACNVLCTVFSPSAFRLAAVPLIVLAVVRRQWRIAIFLFLSVELAGVVTEIAKDVVNRPRPPTAFVAAYSTSFPSGHAMGAMAGVLALSVVLLPMIRDSWRRWAIAAGAVVVVAVGTARVALNVHNPSDVIAGWALGYLYFAGCLLVFARRSVTEEVETPEALDTST